MKKKKLIISTICLCLIILVVSISSMVYINYKNILEDEKDVFREGFAIYLEDDAGNYTSYYGNSFNVDGYSIDYDNTVCVDGENNNVTPSDILSTNSSGDLVVSTTTKIYCDIYLKKD